MEVFEYHYAVSKIQTFFWHDFCDNYIEYVKYRFKDAIGSNDVGSTIDPKNRAAALYCLGKVLRETMLLLAPITPHVSEEIYNQVFYEKGSVHMASWPTAGQTYDADVTQVLVLNEIVTLVRQYKSKSQISQGAELESARISLPGGKLEGGLLDELHKICRIKNIELVNGESIDVSVL